jgi:lipoprotein NlpD
MMMAPAPCSASRSSGDRTLRTVVACFVALALAAGCATRKPAPVEDRTARPTPPTPAAPPSAAASAPPTPSAPEADWRPPTYTVKRGDTLHAIALEHGLDYRDIVAWNAIENPNRIEVGQVLRLGPAGEAAQAVSGGVTTAPLRTAPPIVAQGSTMPAPPAGSRNTDTYKAQPKLFKEPYSEQALREAQRAAAAAPSQATPSAPAPPPAAPAAAAASAPAPVASPPVSEPPVAKSEPKPEPRASNTDGDDDRLHWSWPANGKIVAGFSETANLKGIDIGGVAGTPVVASAAGKVVYAGSGLRGYGKLIIVKHNATYLSAYAHNREILVKEGQQVTRGQKIAEMGNTDTNDVKLHFEIRKLGKPVDPLKYLPPV